MSLSLRQMSSSFPTGASFLYCCFNAEKEWQNAGLGGDGARISPKVFQGLNSLCDTGTAHIHEEYQLLIISEFIYIVNDIF